MVRLAFLTAVASLLITGCGFQNLPPVADAGTDQNVEVGDTAILDGTGSYDPDDGPLTYRWEQTSGPSVSLSGRTTSQPSFFVAEAGEYTFQLSVDDGRDWDLSAVRVTASPLPPVTAHAGSDLTVYSSESVQLFGTGSNDPSGRSIAYLWVQIAGPEVPLLDSTGLAPTFIAPGVSTPTDLIFELTVTASDGRYGMDTVTVTVLPGCLSDAYCDDGIFCDGTESCVSGECVAGDPPCPGSCNEESATCGGGTEFSLGANLDVGDEYSLTPELLTSTGNTPPAASITSLLPPIGDQRCIGSCTAWASAYAGATYSANLTNGWGATSPEHQGSPTYLYKRLLEVEGGVCNDGTYIQDALNILTMEGTPSLASWSYTVPTCPLPGNTCTLNGGSASGLEQFRIGSYRKLPSGLQAVKSEVAAGKIVIFGADVYEDFFHVFGSSVYYTDGVNKQGGHAMAVVGYDDSKGAVRIMNSWTTRWGDSGFLWMSYQTLESTVHFAFSITPRNGSGPPTETDTDGDGIIDASDNCRATPNPDQADSDGDGIGDACDNDAINCQSGYSPAANSPDWCCPDGYPYVWDDGYCYDGPPQQNECSPGYVLAYNDPTVCCPSNYPYNGFDGFCYETDPTDPGSQCSPGYAPAYNYPSICCSTDYPYYWSDGLCHTQAEGSGCSSGYDEAYNNSNVCCPDGYPYDGFDGYCYTCDVANGYSPAINDGGICCPNGYPYYNSSDGLCNQSGSCNPGYAPAINAPSICCLNGYPYYYGGLCYATPLKERQGEKATPMIGQLLSAKAGSARAKPLAEKSRARPQPRRGTQRIELSVRQLRTPTGANEEAAHLVFDVNLSIPINVSQVSITDANGDRAVQDYYVPFGNGQFVFTRRDGRSWLPGKYSLTITGTDRRDIPLSYRATAKLAASNHGGTEDVAPIQSKAVLPDDRMADAVYGDNGFPASVTRAK